MLAIASGMSLQDYYRLNSIEEYNITVDGYFLRRDNENATLRLVAWCAANSGRVKANKPTDLFEIKSIDGIDDTDYVQLLKDQLAKDKAGLEATMKNL